MAWGSPASPNSNRRLLKAAPIAPGALRPTLSRASSRPVASSVPPGGSLNCSAGVPMMVWPPLLQMSVSVGRWSTSASPGNSGASRSFGRMSVRGRRRGDEVALLVGVAPPLAADGEVEQRAGLRRKLAEVAAAAGGASGRGGNATELRANPDHARRVVKEQLAEVALGLGVLEERVGAAVGQPWLRQVGIVGRHLQFVDAADRQVDVAAQLRGAAAGSPRSSRPSRSAVAAPHSSAMAIATAVCSGAPRDSRRVVGAGFGAIRCRFAGSANSLRGAVFMLWCPLRSIEDATQAVDRTAAAWTTGCAAVVTNRSHAN